MLRPLLERFVGIAVAGLPLLILILSAASGGCPGPCGIDPSAADAPVVIAVP